MYLVAGMVARNIAGPGVVLSFIIAAIASIFSGKDKILSSFSTLKIVLIVCFAVVVVVCRECGCPESVCVYLCRTYSTNVHIG